MTKGEQTEADAAAELLEAVLARHILPTGTRAGLDQFWAALRLLLAERMALKEVLMPFAHRGENPNAVLHDDDFRRARSALQGNGGN